MTAQTEYERRIQAARAAIATHPEWMRLSAQPPATCPKCGKKR